MVIKLVVFDMAGTTINEDNLVYKCLHKSIISIVPHLTLDEVLLLGAGKEKRNAIIDIFKNYGLKLSPKVIDQVFINFKNMLDKAYDNFSPQLYPDTITIIEWLRSRSIQVAFNTGYDRQTAEKILHQVGIEVERDIDTLVTASDVARNRPFPDMILKCCNNTSVDPTQSIKVGDSAIDVEEGKNAQVLLSIGITTGAQTQEQISLANPDYIVKNLMELKNIVDSYSV